MLRGTPRNRYLVRADDKKDKKRLLTYSSEGRARAGLKWSGFYNYSNYGDKDYLEIGSEWERVENLEAVEVEMTMVEV